MAKILTTAEEKLKDVDVTKKHYMYRAVGQSLTSKGKLTLSKHFIDAADIIQAQKERIIELEVV